MRDRQNSYDTAKPTETERQKRKTQARLKRRKSEEAKPAETVREQRNDLEQVQIAEAEARICPQPRRKRTHGRHPTRTQPGKAWTARSTLERFLVTRH